MGLESSPDEFIAGMVDVFREVRRVLREDGTLWLNIGDSYNASPAGNKTPSGFSQTRPSRRTGNGDQETVHTGRKLVGGEVKQKDLIGIPWMLAFALRADGWYLRQDIIWSKPNPMPESVRDRCTKSHEYVFLISKSPRYFYDSDAIAEAVAASTIDRLSQPNLDNQSGSERVPGKTNGRMKAVQPRFGGQKYGDDSTEQTRTKSGNGYEIGDGRRNKRSVWSISTQPFKEAHFATFPPGLVEPCILAGCPEGGTVLDPFFGAGTTGLVADRLQRHCIGVELNPEYAAIAQRRINGDSPLFAPVAAEAIA
jgi:DNA modification methylase